MCEVIKTATRMSEGVNVQIMDIHPFTAAISIKFIEA